MTCEYAASKLKTSITTLTFKRGTLVQNVQMNRAAPKINELG